MLKVKEDLFDDELRRLAKAAGVDWLRIKAQIKQESAFDLRAKSPVGAMGLGQFMPATWEEWGLGHDPFDPTANIDATCRYMRWLLDRFRGDWLRALAAYNWGIGNVRRVVAKLGDKWRSGLPYETSHYLDQVQKYYNEYVAKQTQEAA